MSKGPGDLMAAEIAEQPEAVARVVADPAPFREACARARGWGARFTIYAARGTSDNAAVYGKYLAAIVGGMPAGMATPSALTLYGADIDFRRCLVIGISQSGQTPDVAGYLGRARTGGAYTVAITNEQESPLAEAADFVLATRAGAEQAVPATKTYTTQLAALAMLWAAWAKREDLIEALQAEVAPAMRKVVGLEENVMGVARRYRSTDRLLATARGFNYATALEAALKLKESCYLSVLAYSAADLMHGPVALAGEDLPALLFAARGPAYQVMVDVAKDLQGRGAELVVVGNGAQALELAGAAIELPEVAEELSPLLAVLPAQLLAYHLALEKGIDPDRPRGLRKVTPTT
ncbi:MAG: SIS domain-containing protein [Actinomycetota bacterium]|nr:SIS domain-containing protein [Actinomycetota bacterium]